ncbi:DUF2231 domain-containing protein [Lentzea sp. NPDC003310]|uniref:DUF2231 domain-containing protein n=1 Tax=Lentzea sp. NPDC003310 TaxID=3154447 RepID=UPI00339DC394
MRSRVRFAGRSVHPLLVVLPLCLLGASAAVDALHLVTGHPGFSAAAGHLIAAGLLLGVVTASVGWMDRAFASPDEVRRADLLHAVADGGVLALFALSWVLRLGVEGWQPAWPALAASWAGLLVAGFSGWLGVDLAGRPAADEDGRPGSLRTA